MTDATEAVFELENFVASIAIIAIAFIVTKLLRRVLERIVRQSVRPKAFKTKRDELQREDTLISIIATAMKVVVWIFAGLMILSVYGVTIGPLLAGAGIAGVALGFGAQAMVRDFLAGIFILGENQYRVGDVLQVNQGVSGVVEHVSFRMTVIRALDGRVHYIPNGNIEIATNMTMEYAQVELDIGVGYNSDLDEVEKIINKVGEQLYEDPKWKDVALEPAYMLRVDEFADSAIIVKIVCKTAPIRQWEIKSQILRRLKKAFDAAGIEIPYPQRVIHSVNSTEN